MLVYDTLTRWAITGAGRFAAPIIESLVNLVRVEDTMISAILFAWNNFNLFKNCIHGTNDREKYFDKIGRRRISIVCFIMDVYYRDGISIRGNEIEASHLCIPSCSKYKINSTYNTDFCLMEIRELFHS